MPPDTPQHAVRDGEHRLIYVTANGALYKMFPDSGIILPFKSVAVGEQGHMAGYLGYGKVVYDVELIVGTAGITLNPGVYWYRNTGGGWAWERRSAGLPAGRSWIKVEASPVNPDHWLALFDPNFGNRDHVTLDRVTEPNLGVSPLWVTTNAGASWSEVPLLVTPDFNPNAINSVFHHAHCGWYSNGDLWCIGFAGWQTDVSWQSLIRWSGPVGSVGVGQRVGLGGNPYANVQQAAISADDDIIVGGNLGGWPGYNDENMGWINTAGVLALSNPKDTGHAIGPFAVGPARRVLARLRAFPWDPNAAGYYPQGMAYTEDYRDEVTWTMLDTPQQYSSMCYLADGTYLLSNKESGSLGPIARLTWDTMTITDEGVQGDLASYSIRSDKQSRTAAASVGMHGQDLHVYNGSVWGRVNVPVEGYSATRLYMAQCFDVITRGS